MDSLLTSQQDMLHFRECLHQITSHQADEDTASHVLSLMRKYSASFDSITQMADLLIQNAKSTLPFLLTHSKDQLLTVLSESRAGGSLFEQGLKGIVNRKFHPLNHVETAFVLFLELFCTSCITCANIQKSSSESSALAMQAREMKTTIANLRTVFSNMAASELTIDKAISMIQSIDENISPSNKDSEDILSGKGRLTLCTTEDSPEARLNAQQEHIEYTIKNNKLTFSTRMGVDVNIEVDATPKMSSLLHGYGIKFVENKETKKYIIDYRQFKSPEDFTFAQLIALSPIRNYFPKAIKCCETESVPDGTFAKVKAYDRSGKIQTYTLPEPVKPNNG